MIHEARWLFQKQLKINPPRPLLRSFSHSRRCLALELSRKAAMSLIREAPCCFGNQGQMFALGCWGLEQRTVNRYFHSWFDCVNSQTGPGVKRGCGAYPKRGFWPVVPRGALCSVLLWYPCAYRCVRSRRLGQQTGQRRSPEGRSPAPRWGSGAGVVPAIG